MRSLRQKGFRRRDRIMTSPWGNEDTQPLIDILDRYKATFFVVGTLCWHILDFEQLQERYYTLNKFPVANLYLRKQIIFERL